MKLRHLLPILAVICVSVYSSAQLDPRERYGTYLGGGNADCFDTYPDNCTAVGHNYFPSTTSSTAVVIDKLGFICVAGITDAVDFPTTSGAYRRTAHYADNSFGDQMSADSFLTKFTPSGGLVWSTYLGLNANVLAIGFDSSGNITVLGDVNTGDTTRYPFDTPFILKLNSTATTLLSYKQLLPDFSCGTDGAQAYAATFDKWGSIYIVGTDSYSDCFPPTSGANQSGAGFVVKLSSAGSPLYVARMDNPDGVAADSNGNAYLTVFNPSPDVRVVRLNSTGAIVFSHSLGSGGPSFRGAIRLASNGDIIATGTATDGTISATTNFGTPTPSGPETFIVRLNNTGGVIYSAVIHDTNMVPYGLALDSANEAFVTGSLNPRTFSVNRYSNAPGSGAFLVRLNQTGTALWLDSTFGGDSGNGIAVDAAWNALVVGTSKSGEYFPITANAFQSSFKGASAQGFLSKLIIEADVKMLIQSASPNPVAHGSNLTYKLAVLNNGPDVSDGDTVTNVLPNGTTFMSFNNTNGTCTHPAVGTGGTFKCTRSTALSKGSYWGPITLTVHVNAPSGSTIKNTASVAARTQDVVPSNNAATVSVHVQQAVATKITEGFVTWSARDYRTVRSRLPAFY